MFDFDHGHADDTLGTRQKPATWAAVAPAANLKPSNKPKRRKGHGRVELRPDMTMPTKPLTAREKAQLEKMLLYSEKLKHRQEQRDSSLQWLSAEDEEGNVEYKYRILDPNPIRYHQLVTQMKYRLSEGNGECYYYIGVEDDGYPRGLAAAELQGSLETLQGMARGLWATAAVAGRLPGAMGRQCLLVHVTRNTLEDLPLTDLRIAVAGSVDTGKSSLVAVLTHGIDGAPLLDNGRGAARMKAFRHKHEMESGRTSSISQHAVGYDSTGCVLNYAGFSPPTLAEISRTAAHLLTLIDIGGHQRYLKTALYALTAMLPDHLLLATCAAKGPGATTRQHLALAVALELPTAVLLTKVDLVDEAQQAAALGEVRCLVARAMACRRAEAGWVAPDAAQDAVVLVTSEVEAVRQARLMNALHDPARPHRWQAQVPVFALSSVSGVGLPVLHAFLRALQPAAPPAAPPADAAVACAGERVAVHGDVVGCAAGGWPLRHEGDAVHFQVDQTFEVEGVGLVVSGTVVQGLLSVGQQLLWGPCGEGTFQAAAVTGIHRAHIPVKTVRAGQAATLALDIAGASPRAPGAPFASPGSSPPPGETLHRRAASPQPGAVAHLAPAPTACYPSSLLDDLASEMSSDFDQASEPDALDFAASGLPPSPVYPRPQSAPHRGLLGTSVPARGGLSALGGRPSSPPAYVDAHLRLSSSAPTAYSGQGAMGQAHCAPQGSRKGAVLLDPRLQPQTYSEFEAVLVLLGGHWPARGLLSGRWPPVEGDRPGPGPGGESPGSGSDGGAGGGELCYFAGSPAGGRVRRRSKQPCYAPVVHCGSVRQPAEVVRMREVRPEGRAMGAGAGALAGGMRGPTRGAFPGLLVSAQALAPLHAAAVVLQEHGVGQGDLDGGGDVGAVVVVGLRFVNRPEWLTEGSKVLMRDRATGLLAAAGYVQWVG